MAGKHKGNNRKRRSDGESRQAGPDGAATSPVTTLRIIGGEFRGRQLRWTGDAVTRPMKDDVRESLFNLIGGWIPGKHVFDLFAGSGAIGLESISRGALHATMIERHFPTARIIRDNIQTLQVLDRCTVITSDTFFWGRQFLAAGEKQPAHPWAVFCSPPWDLFVERKDDLLALLNGMKQACPPDSLFVVESDERFDPGELPDAGQWRVRNYPPAQLCILRPRGANRWS